MVNHVPYGKAEFLSYLSLLIHQNKLFIQNLCVISILLFYIDLVGTSGYIPVLVYNILLLKII